jgi:hypothetical protein
MSTDNFDPYKGYTIRVIRDGFSGPRVFVSLSTRATNQAVHVTTSLDQACRWIEKQR